MKSRIHTWSCLIPLYENLKLRPPIWPQGLGRNVHGGFWKCSAGLDSRIRDLTTFFVNSAHLHRIQPVDGSRCFCQPEDVHPCSCERESESSPPPFGPLLRGGHCRKHNNGCKLWFGNGKATCSRPSITQSRLTSWTARQKLQQAVNHSILVPLAKCDLLHKVCGLAKAVEWPKFFHRSSSAVDLSFLRTWMWTALNPKSRHSFRIHEPSPTESSMIRGSPSSEKIILIRPNGTHLPGIDPFPPLPWLWKNPSKIEWDRIPTDP